MIEKIVNLGKLKINLDELQAFIVKAGENGYAGNGKYTRMPDGSKVCTFQKGNFHYTDDYAGSLQAPGNEIVRWQKEDGQRIWQRSYSGGILFGFGDYEELVKEAFIFLKKALMNGDNVFRGPPKFENEDFVYRMTKKGDINRFSGREWIIDKKVYYNCTIFSQDFIGGLVIPK